MSVRSFVRAVLLVGMLPVVGAAQGSGPPPTWESAFARTWKGVHDKILAMARDTELPDSKLETKPHPDSRTILDELRHVTIGLEMTTAQLKGEPFDYMAREKADASKPRTRALMIQEMEAAIAASYPLVDSKPSPRLMGWLEHQGEHYGKLVSGYRLAGIVPPISRPKK